MSKELLSTGNLGLQLRKLREEADLPLRKVAALVDVDVAILSKMERGERKLNKVILLKLAKVYDQNANDLMILFIRDKLLYELEDEDLALKALQLAEEQIQYRIFLKTDRKLLAKKA